MSELRITPSGRDVTDEDARVRESWRRGHDRVAIDRLSRQLADLTHLLSDLHIIVSRSGKTT